MRSVLVVLMVLSGSIFAAPTRAAPCRPTELFATDNTTVITDPDSDAAAQLRDGLQLFEARAGATLAHNGETVTGSALLDGFTWSPELQQVTYERSREFHLCGTDGSSRAAAALRRQFHQQTVLTFDYLPQRAPGADSILVTAPGVDAARFHAALTADSAAHTLLPTGSVTTDHTLILVAGVEDLETAHRLVSEAGGNRDTATTAYGRRELVRA